MTLETLAQSMARLSDEANKPAHQDRGWLFIMRVRDLHQFNIISESADALADEQGFYIGYKHYINKGDHAEVRMAVAPDATTYRLYYMEP